MLEISSNAIFCSLECPAVLRMNKWEHFGARSHGHSAHSRRRPFLGNLGRHALGDEQSLHTVRRRIHL